MAKNRAVCSRHLETNSKAAASGTAYKCVTAYRGSE